MIRRLHSQQIWAGVALCRAAFALLRFPLPDLGEKIKEGRVRKIYVKEGTRVKEFEKLADVESDKQFTEITSPQEGIVRKLHYQQNQSCQVGDIFLDLQIEDKVQSPSTTATAPSTPAVSVSNPIPVVIQPTSTSITVPVATNYEVLASATVRMLAKQHKINLQSLAGTGKKGRVLKDDIVYELERRQNQPLNTQSLRVPISGQWLKLVNASNSIPHLQLTETFDLTSAVKFTSLLSSQSNSLLSVLIKTFSLALTQHSRINSTYNINEPFNFKTHPSHQLLLSLPGGYTLLQNLQNQSILSIQKIIAGATFQSELNESYAASATVAISHLGQEGGLSVNPLILGQLVCHANVGRIHEIVTMRGGSIQRKQVAEVTLGCDHRVLDGASVARFAVTWRQLSENPALAFLRLI